MVPQRAKVECYSGHRYGERPRAFTWRGQRHRVQAVRREWRTPQGLSFQVVTDEGEDYLLFYWEEADLWWVKELAGKETP